MAIEYQAIKNIIVAKFERSIFELIDPIPLDPEICEFIFDINKSKDIITTNSCAGHPELNSHPYLAFVVSERGWDIFWAHALPEISFKCLIHVSIIAEHSEKIAIVLRAHHEDKIQFWHTVKSSFTAKYVHAP